MKRFTFLVSAVFVVFQVTAQKFDKQSHRGGKGLMPENTIAAMKNAVDFGTSLEMDLYITKDQQIVVTHDNHIMSAYTLDPGGKPVAKEDEAKLRIDSLTYEQIRGYDIGSKPYPEFPRQKKMKISIPLLSELIDSVEAYAKVKHLPPPHYNIQPGPAYTITDEFRVYFIKKMMDIILENGIEDRVMIQAFDTGMLETEHRLYPKMPVSYLVAKGTLEENLSKLTFLPQIYSPIYKLVEKGLVEECHRKKMLVIPWTVNEKKEIEGLKALHVDGIITDYPDLF